MQTTHLQPDLEPAAVTGFQAAGIAAGIKKHGGLDLALIVGDRPCTAAAVFTKNRVQAAPVLFDCALMQRNPTGLWAVVINSGCANAVTGEGGMRNAQAMAQVVIDTLGLETDSVFVMSTGVIGQHLPMEQVTAGIREAAQHLARHADAVKAAAQAIMTTDTRPKMASLHTTLAAQPVKITGICKGAGMIHPDMATLLAAVWTDAAVAEDALNKALRYAVERSFNCMTVDGDTSTNDTLLVLANGAAGNQPITTDDPSAFAHFQEALTSVCVALAQQVARDGEGATKFVTIEVTGARSFEEARQAGRTIASSSLVKTAIYGADANWGRVLMALGRSGVAIDPQRLALWFDDVQLVDGGAPLDYSEDDAHATLTKADVRIRVDLGLGGAAATVWTCDFSHEYVTINADYRT